MAVVIHPQIFTSPAFHDSPTLSCAESNTHPIIQPFLAPHTHNAKYSTALEAEHSRDLYLQGAMAVGQIARLLEELCADISDANDHDEEERENAEEMVDVDELSSHLSDPIDIYQYVSHEKRVQIAAWARAVSPADDNTRGLAQPLCDADDDIILDLEDADATYLRGAFVVGDIADLLDDLVNGFDVEREEARKEVDCETNSSVAFSLEQVALAQLSASEPSSLSMNCEIPDSASEFASRLRCLSARLAKLEMDINNFSQDRSDAFNQLGLDCADSAPVATQASGDEGYDWFRCDEVLEGVDSRKVYKEYPADALGICDISESEESLLINRVWTTTDTATSGFSLVTPSGSEIQHNFEQTVKGYFWNLD